MTYRENMKPEQEFRDRHARKLREAILGKSTVIDIRILDDGTKGTFRTPASGPIDGLDLRTLRILILAEACDPQGTRVASEAYALVKALARRADLEVTLVTHFRNREVLQNDEILRGLHAIAFIESEPLARPMKSLGKLFRSDESFGSTTDENVSWLGYVRFEWMVWERFGQEIKEGGFDLIHRVTPVSPTLPSPMAGWSATPFVVGPLSGGPAWPIEYPELGIGERGWLRPLRRVYRYLPWHKRMRRRSAMIIGCCRSIAAEMGDVPPERLEYLPRGGFDSDLLAELQSERQTVVDRETPCKLVSVSRFVPYEALDIAMDALAECRESWSAWTIVGDGPSRESLEKKAARMGLSDRITFTGSISQESVLKILTENDVLLQPSLREFGGGAVVEAMACGTVPLIVDYGGPSELVAEGCGIKLPMAERATIIESLIRAVKAFHQHPHRLKSMSDRGRKHVQENLTWTAKAERLDILYRRLVGRDAK